MKNFKQVTSLVFILILVLQYSPAISQQQCFFNVLDYGAQNDGVTKNTQAIKKTIDAAAAKGGGTVFFPAGEYLTGPIHFKSNITLYIDAGAVIKFSQEFNDYLPMVRTRYEGVEVINFSAPIYGYRLENIAICGRGQIDGNGAPWWDFRKKYSEIKSGEYTEDIQLWQNEFIEKNRNTPSWDYWVEKAGDLPVPFLRPSLIQTVECKNVLIEGISIKDPPMWTVHPIYSENVTIDGISIHNPADSPNTDGINPDACKYVHISNCHISVGDDCITIKSGRDADGRRVGRACENVTITNCTMLDGHGGVVIGSEMSGDVRKVTISNCVFDGTDRGIRIKSMRGRGGVVEEIRVSNIVMKNIKQDAVKLNMFYHPTPDEPVSERTPSFRNIHLSDITVTQSQRAGFLLGLAELPIENITFNNININAKTGFTIKDAKNIAFHNVQVNVEQGPGLHAEKTENLEISGFKTLHPLAGQPFIDVNNVQNFYLYNCIPHAGTEPFLDISGKSCKNIVVQNNNFIHVNKPVSIGGDVPKDAVVQQ